MRKLIRVACLVATLVPVRTSAQLIPEAVSCARCAIESRVVLRIGTNDGPGSLTGRPFDVLVDGRGRYWVSVLDQFPMIFDASGKFIRELGKRGAGPGEFQHPGVIAALPGDSVLINDMNRVSVVTPDFTVARMIRHQTSGFWLRPLQWPVSSLAHIADYRHRPGGYRLALIDLSGDELRETKVVSDLKQLSEVPSNSNLHGALQQRMLANAASDHIWVGYRARYRLVRYNSSGVAQDSIERRPDWFSAPVAYQFGSATRPPAPRLTDLSEDAGGRLWVFAAVPRRDYAKAWAGSKIPGQGAGEVRVSDLPPDYALWQTLVEVIDVRGKRVIARKLLDGFVISTLPQNRIATFVENDLGIPVVTIHELKLTGM